MGWDGSCDGGVTMVIWNIWYVGRGISWLFFGVLDLEHSCVYTFCVSNSRVRYAHTKNDGNDDDDNDYYVDDEYIHSTASWGIIMCAEWIRGVRFRKLVYLYTYN